MTSATDSSAKIPVQSQARTAAVIDVGTSSIRMAVAQIDATGNVQILETLSQGVSLGKDTFTAGEIMRPTIEECVSVLQSYRDKLAEYQITDPRDIRVIATSAVREASNRLAFLDRVYVGTDFHVEPLDEAEVHRITYRSIRPHLGESQDFLQSRVVITEVGGGSTELLLVENGKSPIRILIVWDHSGFVKTCTAIAHQQIRFATSW